MFVNETTLDKVYEESANENGYAAPYRTEKWLVQYRNRIRTVRKIDPDLTVHLNALPAKERPEGIIENKVKGDTYSVVVVVTAA